MNKLYLSHFLFLLLLTPLAQAQDHDEDGDPHHDSVIHLGPIDVLGEMGSSDILHTVPTVSNLHGDKLFKQSRNSLGETLRNELGVNSSQFGPAASRPVIRGLGGDRIRILQNGIGVLDASGTSQDHAVPINPLTAESVEIVRGPISLLYGSSAVGGVVNIVNSRIHKNYSQGFFGDFDLKSESVNAGQTYATKMDYGANNLMVHFDANYTRALNTQTPLGPIANSQQEQHGVAIGTTYFTAKKNYLGLSYSSYQNIYGVVSETDVVINLKQQRIDLGGYYQLGGFIKGARIKSAETFYNHTEFENGGTGTIFKNSGNETRLELVQKNINGFHGLFGLQTQVLTLSALGDEAFLPTTNHRAAALFAFEELELQDWKFNLGARAEATQLKTQGVGFFNSPQDKDFATTSSALGAVYSLNQATSTTLNLSYNERAPTYQELFAKGAHLALNVYQIGDINLQKEKSVNVEWSIKRKTPLFYTGLTVFNQEFSNFISLTPTGAVDGGSGLDVFQSMSQRARINGVEFEARHKIKGFYSFRFTTDYLYGQNLDSNTPLPRISPMRVGLQLGYDDKTFAASTQWRSVLKQTRTAPTETATAGYNTLAINLEYKWKMGQGQQAKFYAQLDNIGNVQARNHVSLLKDRLLLPGRNLMVGLRYLF